jgi:hypothetical protein
MNVHELIITHEFDLSTYLAGVGGIEPTGLGVKAPCLNHLAKPLLTCPADVTGIALFFYLH